MKKVFLAVLVIIVLVFAPSATGAADLVITGTTGGWTYSDNEYVISLNGAYTISGVTTADRVVVKPGVNADITLNGLNIDVNDATGVCAFNMTGATVRMTLTGNSTLVSGGDRAALEAPTGSNLTIGGAGSLTAIGGAYGAGIGGGRGTSGVDARNGTCGTVVINSGVVVASSVGYGAGIGGGGSGGDGGIITINGGDVTASGGNWAAGIGGGNGHPGGVTTINGGSVTAWGGGSSAGIGGGNNHPGGVIIINDGKVNATGGQGGAGIGGGLGHLGAGGSITIKGGTIIAQGGEGVFATGGGAGIGSGGSLSGEKSGAAGTITIIGDSTVTATGGNSQQGAGAGIGSGGTGSGVSSAGDVHTTGNLITIDSYGPIIRAGGAGIASAGGVRDGAHIGYGGAQDGPGREVNILVPTDYSLIHSDGKLYLDIDGSGAINPAYEYAGQKTVYSWDPTVNQRTRTGSLILNGFTWGTPAKTALKLKGSASVIAWMGSVNSYRTVYNGSDAAYGITCEDKLVMSGMGVLKANASESTSANSIGLSFIEMEIMNSGNTTIALGNSRAFSSNAIKLPYSYSWAVNTDAREPASGTLKMYPSEAYSYSNSHKYAKFGPYIFKNGSGTEADPYIITNAMELDAVRGCLFLICKLGNDIDLTAYLASGGDGYAKWGAKGWLPIGDDITLATYGSAFSGSLDGAGYKITGLWIDRSDMSYMGLFSDTYNAKIKNLGIVIDARGVSGSYPVGGLMGANRGGSIENCYVIGGNVSSKENYIGGLVGFQQNSRIENCYSYVDITGTGTGIGGLVGIQSGGSILNCYSTGNVSGTNFGGGFVGVVSGGSITNCYATGNVKITGNYAGGFSGYDDGSIVNCYAAGNIVSTGNDAGGLGSIQSTGKIENSYRYELSTLNNAVITENNPNGANGGVKTATELMTQTTYSGNGWQFTSAGPWYWDSGNYPKLNIGVEVRPFNFYTVTYDLDGGVQQPGSWGSYTQGIGLTLPTAPTKPGYSFDGWYEASTRVTVISTTDTGNKQYSARWSTSPPRITGPATMTLTAGYSPISTGEYTVTGTAPITVTKTSGVDNITWNNTTKKLDIASGLSAGNYPVVLTASNGTLTDTASFTLTVNALSVAPAINGPVAMSLTEGYAATSTGEYTITGSEPITVTKTSGASSITWNNSTKKLDIAEGLTVGSYPVVLTVGNGTPPEATATFTLTVNSAPDPISVAGPNSMSLSVGYAATSTEAYTVTGTPAPAVTKTSGASSITWNGATNKLDIAAGLSSGDYPVILTASNGVQPDATLAFTLAVRDTGVAPTISGPTYVWLSDNYPEFTVGVYVISGSEPVSVDYRDINSGGKITWNKDTRTLHIATGLSAGYYGFGLTPRNSAGSGSELQFMLEVDIKHANSSISGPSSQRLNEGYDPASVGPYAIAGTSPVVVTVNNDYGGKITWNAFRNMLDIAAGLPLGSYPVVLTASNMTSPDAKLTFTLTVSNSSVTGVTLDRTSAAIDLGFAVQLKETVTPSDAADKSVMWSTSNASVATVNALGFVKAVGAGDAVIIVTTHDGGHSATCLVHVDSPIFLSNDIIPTQPNLPPGTPVGIVSADPIIIIPADPSDISPEADWVASVIPGVGSTDLHTNEYGILTIGNWKAKEIAEKLLSVDVAEVLPLPIFEAYLNNPGETGAVSFKVKGNQLMMNGLISKPENVRLMNILPPDSGDWYTYTGTANALDDKTFTILDMNNNIVTGELDPNGDYYLLFLIKDGGGYDLDGKADGTIWGVLSLVGVPVSQITLAPGSLNMTPGGNFNLSGGVGIVPAIADNPAITWSSDNDSVATVSQSGVVTALKAGSANITVTTKDRGLKASCAVTVNSSVVLVTEIKVSQASAVLEIGYTYNFTATVLPSNATNPSVTWSSNNPAVATVSNTGVVTTVAEGVATITATAVDGSGVFGSCVITALWPISVKPVYPPKNEVVGKTDIDPDDLYEEGDKVYLKDPAADTIAKDVLDKHKSWTSDKAVYLHVLPVFKGIITPNGAVARISFTMTGKELLESYPEDINLIGMILSGRGMLFDYVNRESEFGDAKFTLLLNDRIFDGKINPDGVYELVVFIKDGGVFDLDGLENGEVICSLFIASEKNDHKGGGGCNAGVFGGLVGLLLLALKKQGLGKNS